MKLFLCFLLELFTATDGRLPARGHARRVLFETSRMSGKRTIADTTIFLNLKISSEEAALR